MLSCLLINQILNLRKKYVWVFGKIFNVYTVIGRADRIQSLIAKKNNDPKAKQVTSIPILKEAAIYLHVYVFWELITRSLN